MAPRIVRLSNTFIAGVDGCKNGWVIASQDADGRPAVNLVSHFGEILDYDHKLVVVDIPIGLLDRGTRLADQAARRILKGRACCVFTAPLRPMLACRDYSEAKGCRQKIDGKGLAKQAWAITTKIVEVDRLIRSETQSRIREGHPEVSFAQMNRGQALARSKHTPEGQHERISLLTTHFPGLPHLVQKYSRLAEDVIDAFAMLWTAHRICNKQALALPEKSETDARGLLMQ